MEKEPSPQRDETLPLPSTDPVVPEIAAQTEQEALATPTASAPPPMPFGTQRTAEETDFELQRKAALLEGLRQDIEARKRYAKNIFRLIVVWLAAIFLLLLLQGASGDRELPLAMRIGSWECKTAFKFRLSDTVLVALIGGTTANVLGLFIFVVQYLFPKRDT